MKLLISFVALFTFWTATLNSGQTSQIWITPKSDKQIKTKNLSINSYKQERVAKVLNYVDSKELECMSKNIYFEAALESTAGKMAVAQVTMNRVNSTKFPNTVCSVVYQGKHYKSGIPVRDRCQFSWYCDGKDDKPYYGAMWRESADVAFYVLSSPNLKDITDGATHYHADYIPNPRWADSRRKTVKIDTHIFYNHSRKKI